MGKLVLQCDFCRFLKWLDGPENNRNRILGNFGLICTSLAGHFCKYCQSVEKLSCCHYQSTRGNGRPLQIIMQCNMYCKITRNAMLHVMQCKMRNHVAVTCIAT